MMTQAVTCNGKLIAAGRKALAMMNLFLRSPKAVDYKTFSWFESTTYPGVRFAIRDISLMQRIELSKRLKDLISKNEFLKAGDQIDQQHAQLADLLARKTYPEWG